MLSAPSQVLVRNQEHFANGKWLLVNPTEAAIFDQLNHQAVDGFHQYYDIYQQCLASKAAGQHFFGAACDDIEKYDGAIIYMPKSKEQAAMLIANMTSCVKEQGHIFLVGENKSGIKGAPKLFDRVSMTTNKIDSARHCALYCAQLEKPIVFDINKWVQFKELEIKDTRINIAFLPGVFSAGELDAGTKLLLDNISPKISGEVLDFACGAGIIGCAIAASYQDINLTLCDVSALALHCTELSLEKNHLKGRVVPSNGLNDIAGKFNAIVTNPPFHTGIKTDYSVTEKFINEAKSRLLANASLVLVANRFLPYPDILKNAFGHVSTVAQTSKFNLYKC